MTTPHVKLLRDLVLIRPMPLGLKKTADGIILPGDVDKLAPKRATVVATGPGVYDKKGKFIKATCKPGDQILYMERNLIPTKIDGEEFFILQQEDVILKFDKVDLENDSLPEMTDEAYYAETMRRKLIKWMTDAGMVRVQDMVNPVETFITPDGETVVGTAKSFMLIEEAFDQPFVPPEGMVAFSMLKVHYLKVGGGYSLDPVTFEPTNEWVPESIKVVARLSYLPRADVTLG